MSDQPPLHRLNGGNPSHSIHPLDSSLPLAKAARRYLNSVNLNMSSAAPSSDDSSTSSQPRRVSDPEVDLLGLAQARLLGSAVNGGSMYVPQFAAPTSLPLAMGLGHGNPPGNLIVPRDAKVMPPRGGGMSSGAPSGDHLPQDQDMNVPGGVRFCPPEREDWKTLMKEVMRAREETQKVHQRPKTKSIQKAPVVNRASQHKAEAPPNYGNNGWTPAPTTKPNLKETSLPEIKQQIALSNDRAERRKRLRLAEAKGLLSKKARTVIYEKQRKSADVLGDSLPTDVMDKINSAVQQVAASAAQRVNKSSLQKQAGTNASSPIEAAASKRLPLKKRLSFTKESQQQQQDEMNPQRLRRLREESSRQLLQDGALQSIYLETTSTPPSKNRALEILGSAALRKEEQNQGETRAQRRRRLREEASRRLMVQSEIRPSQPTRAPKKSRALDLLGSAAEITKAVPMRVQKEEPLNSRVITKQSVDDRLSKLISSVPLVDSIKEARFSRDQMIDLSSHQVATGLKDLALGSKLTLKMDSETYVTVRIESVKRG